MTVKRFLVVDSRTGEVRQIGTTISRRRTRPSAASNQVIVPLLGAVDVLSITVYRQVGNVLTAVRPRVDLEDLEKPDAAERVYIPVQDGDLIQQSEGSEIAYVPVTEKDAVRCLRMSDRRKLPSFKSVPPRRP